MKVLYRKISSLYTIGKKVLIDQKYFKLKLNIFQFESYLGNKIDIVMSTKNKAPHRKQR